MYTGNMLNRNVLILLSLFIPAFYCLITSFQTKNNHENIIPEIEADTCLAQSLLIESKWLEEDGKYQEAITTIEAASNIYKAHQFWEKYVETLVEIAVFADYLDYDIKANYAKEALAAAQAYLPKNHLLLADAYRQNGEVYTAFQHYDSSLYCYEQALPIFQAHQNNNQIAWTKILQAINYYYMGENETGQQLLEEDFWSLQTFSKDIYATLYNLRGVFYREAGDLSQVINNTEQALALELSNNPSDFDTSFVATLNNNLGIAYDKKGDLRRAIDYYQNALDLFKESPGYIASQINSRENIAVSLRSQKRSEASISYFHENLTLIEQNPQLPRFKRHLYDHYINLGQAYRETTQYDSALYYLNKAVEFEDEDCLPLARYAIGRYYTQTNQLDLAIINLEQAIACFQQQQKDLSITLNRIYHRLGDAYALKKSYRKALQCYQKALVSVKADFSDTSDLHANPNLDGIINDDTYFLESLHEKARMFLLLSDSPQDIVSSLSTYLLSIQWTDSLRQSYVLEENELFWGEKFKIIYGEAIYTASRLFEKTKDQTYLKTALTLSEKSKSILLLEAFTTNTEGQNTGVPQEILEKERDLSIDIAFYEKSQHKAIQDKDSAKVQLFQNYLRDSRLALASLKEKIERDYPDYFRLKYEGQSVDIYQIQESLLDHETALVEYFIGKEHAYAFVLDKDTLQMVPLEHPDSINQRLSQFSPLLFDIRAFLNDPQQAFLQFNSTAYQLYNSLFEVTQKCLAADINKLIIIPDEGLNALAFELLNTQLIDEPSSNFGKLPYLLKDYQIHYGYSIKLLQKNRERHLQLKPNSRCLAFAPPYKNDAEIIAQLDLRSSQVRGGITPLENTAAEINAIEQYFDGLFVSTTGATKANFMAKAENYGILHLAMHGEADFENTKFGHLIFSNADTNSLQHNLLYHYEISNLNLNAQLAVLSACETGVGKYESGEGVFSIARSFMYAGVPSIVMSLWKVNDQSTSQIMPAFYKRLAQGMEKNQALREAKLEYLENADIAFKHPFYWASFVALGDPQPLSFPIPLGRIIGGIGLAFICIGIYIWYRRK